MQITVKVADIARELNLLEKIVDRKPTIPVLSNVLIQAGGGGLLLSGTDLEVALIGVCTAEVTVPGAVTLPARKLMEIVRAQSGDTVTIVRGDNGVARLSSGRFNSRLQCLPVEDFPSLASIEGHPSAKLPRTLMKDMIAQVRYAVSDKDTKFYLKGAVLVVDDGQLSMIATDQMRLSYTQNPWVADVPQTILTSSALDELALLLAEPGEDDITFAQSDRHLFFDLDGRLLIARKVDAKFPNYKRFIPQDNVHRATINRLDFISVLKRLILVAETVQLTVDGGQLEAIAQSVDVGDGHEHLPIAYDGPQIKVRLNGQYMLDFLGASQSETIVLALKDSETGALFEDNRYINVIMGMRI